MKIVIYSANSNIFDGTMHYTNWPLNSVFWENYNEHEFIFITERPGLFLLDLKNSELSNKAKNAIYYLQSPTSEFIKQLNPDLVIAATFWVTPFDWLPIKDALIAQELKNSGIKVICHNVKTAQICFDKRQTHDFLVQNNFNVAKAVYVHHELFWAERNHHEIKENFYKQSIFAQIKELKLPLIIKDTVGLSSYGMEVCTTYNQVIGFLNSKKNNGDKLIEEFIEGKQFGTEIHGNKDLGYKIFKPFRFSVNQYGITSPKQSIKIGPISNNFNELEAELLRLSKLMDFNGVAQVDLVFNEVQCKWYIIEINPRLSGMTQTLLQSKNEKPTMAIKLPILSENQIEELKQFSFIKHISQVVNDEAKQRRECGYCEIIMCCESFSLILESLDKIKSKYPELIDEGFYIQAENLINEQMVM